MTYSFCEALFVRAPRHGEAFGAEQHARSESGRLLGKR
jgi:hypothetical protein